MDGDNGLVKTAVTRLVWLFSRTFNKTDRKCHICLPVQHYTAQ